MPRLAAFLLAAITAFAFGVSNADQGTNRKLAMDKLWKGYTQFRLGNQAGGKDSVREALAIDPNLAQANIIWAEFAMSEEQWDTARVYFERGISLLDEPDQPLSPDPDTVMPLEGVKGDAYCMLGGSYVYCAAHANRRGNTILEQKYLERAHECLTAGLKLSPSDEMRSWAEHLLRSFR